MTLERLSPDQKKVLDLLTATPTEVQEAMVEVIRRYQSRLDEVQSIASDAVDLWRGLLGDGCPAGYAEEATAIVMRAITAGIAEADEPCPGCGGYDANETCDCEDADAE